MDAGMTRQAAGAHPDPSRKRFRGVKPEAAATRTRTGILMPSSNGGAGPPFPDRRVDPASRVSSASGGRSRHAEIGKDLLHLCCDPGQIQSAAETVPQPMPADGEENEQLPLPLRDREQNQAPAIRGVDLARCVDAPVAPLQGRKPRSPRRDRRCHPGSSSATHPKYGSAGPRLADPPSPSARSTRAEIQPPHRRDRTGLWCEAARL